MKKLVLFIGSAILLGVVLSSFAQDTTTQRIQTHKRDRIHQNNYFMFEKGKLYMADEGKRTEIMQSMKFGSGLTVNPNGTYHYRNMKQLQLKEGECIDMYANRYSNQEMMRKHLREGSMNNQKPNQGPANRSKGRKY